MQLMSPLEVISKLSLRTIEKTQVANRSRGLEEESRVFLSNMGRSQISLQSNLQPASVEEKIAFLMIKNLDLKTDETANQAAAKLFRKQLDAMS